ncbi:hypothetical protein [Streptomyces lydicus]|uniref:hypothetical protein n=1 Tax=Streptomyces lydicus TaxID=47763 RepID=UPI0010124FB7|nr:hypothetical protein [Streptomyces lydicus]MCZ1012105.1 hypothetical protein [Streptomyces lydicus]
MRRSAVRAHPDGRRRHAQQRLGEEELGRTVHANAVHRGVLERAGSADTGRTADRSILLAMRTGEALLRTTGWGDDRLARLIVRDIMLVDGR